ncbi:MAG: flagellar hook capping FlgD N-terminal domain-containing protein [Candidatus Cloacimonetes bacterium]|jgi:flagellar basal-body rod modification protein FlgD|nr:flagellar hook capping FlgD N-terminal domain-containing protein [Candidatus Cloacimonadota bacterium]
MDLVGISSNTAQQATETLTGQSVMAKDDFLRMLTMQMKYQDPLNPMSNDQFAAQLAQFSSLESLNNINENIQTEILMMQSMNNSYMMNMIGKDVVAYGDTVRLTEDGAKMQFELLGNADNVKVKIFDEDGKEIAQIDAQSMKAGERYVNWDGMTKDGVMADEGIYTYQVLASTSDGTIVSSETLNNGTVTGISYDGGIPYLVINGSYVSIGDVVSVNMPQETDSGSNDG